MIFKDLLSKVLAGVGVLFFISSLFLYASNSSKESTIVELNSRVSELTNKNDVLESRIENCQRSFDAAMDSKQRQQDIINTVSENEKKTVEQLIKIQTENKPEAQKNDSKVSSSNTLSPSTVRLLTEYCSKVTGSTCPNP